MNKRFFKLIAFVAAIVLAAIACTVEYIYHGIALVNNSSYNIHIQWDIETEGVQNFALPIGETKESKTKRYPPPQVSSATITFEDGKVLKYSKKDKGRSLCNQRYLKSVPVTNKHDFLEFHTFTITDEDYALAVMPSEK